MGGRRRRRRRRRRHRESGLWLRWGPGTLALRGRRCERKTPQVGVGVSVPSRNRPRWARHIAAARGGTGVADARAPTSLRGRARPSRAGAVLTPRPSVSDVRLRVWPAPPAGRRREVSAAQACDPAGSAVSGGQREPPLCREVPARRAGAPAYWGETVSSLPCLKLFISPAWPWQVSISESAYGPYT